MKKDKKVLGIVVGGGPAPGINGVISALSIEALNSNFKVIGIKDGFKWFVKGDYSHIEELTLEKVSRIYKEGGSILSTSRTAIKNDKDMENVLKGLNKLGIKYLATIGGDDTASSSIKIEKASKGEIRVVHIPKTIDNDLPLPPTLCTFGFQTARHYGVEIVERLMEDAITTKRWYICEVMGRKAGHLALEIGKAANVPIIVIPEEFSDNVPLEVICDFIEGSILKSRILNRYYGVAVVAEGIIYKIRKKDIEEELVKLKKDDFGHLNISQLNIAKIISQRLEKRFEERKDKIRIIWGNIGYELRCAPPIPFDCEYTRDLGYGAMQFLKKGGSGAMISIQAGKAIPMFFNEIIEPNDNKKDDKKIKIKVRLVDITTESYKVSLEYQLRLDKEDLKFEIDKLEKVSNIPKDKLIERFEYLTRNNEYMYVLPIS